MCPLADKVTGGPPPPSTPPAGCASLLTYREVAAHANRSRQHAKRAVRAGTLPMARTDDTKYGRRKLFCPTAVAGWVVAGCPAPLPRRKSNPPTDAEEECGCGCGRPLSLFRR